MLHYQALGAKRQNCLFVFFLKQVSFGRSFLKFFALQKTVLQKFQINKLNRFAKSCFVFQPLTLIRLFKHILCNFN